MRHELPKAESHCNCGIWLGKCTHNDQHFIGTSGGVIGTRNFEGLPKSERYQIDDLKKAIGTRWQARGPEGDYPLCLLPTEPAAVPKIARGLPRRCNE